MARVSPVDDAAAQAAKVRTIWRIATAASLLIGGFLVSVWLGTRSLSFLEARSLLDALSADGRVDSFTASSLAAIRLGLLGIGLALLATGCALLVAPNAARRLLGAALSRGAEIIREDRAEARSVLGKRPRWRGAHVILFVVFWGLYLGIGLSLGGTVLERNDAMFDADMEVVIKNVTTFRTDHTHANPHPLFLVFVNPPGVALKAVLGSAVGAVLLLTSLAGALSVFFAASFFERVGIRRAAAHLWAVIFGLSSSQIFWSCAPETYSFAPVGLAALLFAVAAAPGNLLLAAPPAIYLCGITPTQIVACAIAFVSGLRARALSVGRGAARLAGFLVLVVAAASLLNVIQVVAYRTWPGWLPWAYTAKLAWVVEIEDLRALWLRLALLVEHVFVYDVVAPTPFHRFLGAHLDHSNVREILAGLPVGSRPGGVTFQVSSMTAFTAPGFLAAALWIGLFAIGVVVRVRSRGKDRALLDGVLVAIVVALAFHLRFGHDLFLYSANWTFLVVAAAALALRDLSASRILIAALAALALLLLVNDALFFSILAGYFRK